MKRYYIADLINKEFRWTDDVEIAYDLSNSDDYLVLDIVNEIEIYAFKKAELLNKSDGYVSTKLIREWSSSDE